MEEVAVSGTILSLKSRNKQQFFQVHYKLSFYKLARYR
uniref:Uncharacterized protein n=1 Tax=Rhizophora mucronata TaxID=61149 RepID=A0A2P2NJP8_RHIMU